MSAIYECPMHVEFGSAVPGRIFIAEQLSSNDTARTACPRRFYRGLVDLWGAYIGVVMAITVLLRVRCAAVGRP